MFKPLMCHLYVSICVYNIDLYQQRSLISLFYIYALKLLVHSMVSHSMCHQNFADFLHFCHLFANIFTYFMCYLSHMSYMYILINMVY